MIPWILIIGGVLCALIGALILLMLLFLPIYERFELVFDKEKEIYQARTEPLFIKLVRQEKAKLIRDSVILVCVGIMSFYAGLYLGYAAKGEGFWLYKKLFPSEAVSQELVSDKINEKGQYVAEDGKTYTYYVYVDGNDVSLSGELCADLEDLKTRLSEIRRDNTVILYDYFAVSSTYRKVADMLDELGFDYEETR